ncbi:MAG: 4Fe-4S dicluster domain-containing protein [Candidatus Omnitrophota bacterium]|nr:4Fe-4S dicluster domain-containing protein [Candidatus Omnitrophota bacterium]
MTTIISKEKLYKLLGSLLPEFEVIGPVKIANKGLFFRAITDIGDLSLGNDFTVEPVKKFFLEPSEWLVRSKFEGRKIYMENPALPGNKRIIIGLRPCEARGLELLDKVFNSEYKDRSYINNRERSVIIGLACSRPDRTCFCTSIGGSPAEARGMDAIIFINAGMPEFAVEVITEKGRGVLASLGEDLTEDRKKALQREKEKMKDLVGTKFAIRDTLGDTFQSPYWEEVSRSCVGCGVCTYLCPTCHCFDLVDETRKRLRCYDGCSFKNFTQEASGENPRPTTRERYRQRVFHKFDYFKKNFGEHLCVGCGRCIRYCPVKMDISEIAAGAPKTGNG